jgi:hypothetical protein
MRLNGIALPTTTGDLYSLAEQIMALEAEADRLDASSGMGWQAEMPPGLSLADQQTWAFNNTSYGPSTPAGYAKRQLAAKLKEGLFAMAGQLFGSQGQTIVSRTLRPPVPSVAKLPTPEEFLGGYEEAFATHVEGLGLSAEEKKFAYDVMRNETYQKYMSKLGEFAKAGLSPFTMKEVSRAERGVGADTAAGAAMDKALGPGVTEPTTVSGTGEEVSKAMDAAGQGVPREFTTVPRLMPSDFLAQLLSPIAIKTAFAGSAEGALKTSRRIPAGFVSNPKRV